MQVNIRFSTVVLLIEVVLMVIQQFGNLTIPFWVWIVWTLIALILNAIGQ